MARHRLDAKTVEKAKPEAKPYRLADGDGLYLYVATSGVKSWQYRYRHEGKQQTLTLGKLSAVLTLAEARRRAERARDKADAGEHLTRDKRLQRAVKSADASNTFKLVAKRWARLEARRNVWTEDYQQEVSASLANHLSGLDGLPIADVTPRIAAPMLRKVEASAPDMAKKVRQRLRAILDFAVEDGLVPVNPIPVPRRRKAAATRKHLPAITDHHEVGAILRAADKADVGRGVTRAHLLAVFTAQRMSEIVGAKWEEVDLEAGLWTIPRDRMKLKREDRGPHVVPVPPRLLGAMKEWRRVDGKGAVYVCPSREGNPVTREAVEKFYRRTLNLRGKHSPHSWRTVLSTWANDAGQDTDVVEAQLDHVVGSKVKAAYDRARRLDRRAELMNWHEDALVAARDGAQVLPIRPGKSLA
jgi:integrase